MTHENDHITEGMDGVRLVVSSISVSGHWRSELRHHGRAIVLNVGNDGEAVYLSREQARAMAAAVRKMVGE
jgi:hypothetical protein